MWFFFFSFRPFFDCSTHLRGSLSVWHVCQRGVWPVWGVLTRLCHVPDCQFVPAVSQWTLYGKQEVCGGVSEVLLQFHLLSLLNSHKCKTSVTSCSYLSGLLLRGIPKDLECLPCSTGCGSCVESIFHCLSCERPYLLLNNSCVLQCPEGYYANDTECYHCPAHCTECNQYGLCKSKYDRWNSEVERNGRCGKELFWKAILAEQIREMRKGCRRGIDRKCRELCRCCLDC